jgi:energy-coupling factor transport system permease protein
MSAPTVSTTTARDPYAAAPPAPPARFLHGLNPIAKIASPLPAIIALLFTRGLAIPLAFTVLALALLLVGARLSGRVVAALLIATPAGVALVGLSLGLWVDPARVDAAGPAASVVLFGIGDWTFTLGAYLVGVATALRIAAILMLSLIAGLTTTGPELVRAVVQNLRVPYRIGYTALAAFRFVPRFGHELDVIRQAHRVRGAHGGRGPFSAIARWFGYIVPLMAGAIRHAERVALAMDARAFGAHPDRTERHLVPFRARDVVFIALFLVASAAIFTAFVL